MRCAEVQGLFSEIYDNRAEDQALLISHIENCSDCTNEYRAYSQLLDELRQLPEPDLPEGFHETAMDNIRALMQFTPQREVRRSRRNTKTAGFAARRWAGIAVVACLLLMSLWAVRVFNFGQRHDDFEYAAPQAAADMAVTAPAPTEAAPVVEELADEFLDNLELAAEAEWMDDDALWDGRGRVWGYQEEEQEPLDFNMTVESFDDDMGYDVPIAAVDMFAGAIDEGDLSFRHGDYDFDDMAIESFGAAEIGGTGGVTERMSTTDSVPMALDIDGYSDAHNQGGSTLGAILVFAAILLATVVLGLVVRKKLAGGSDEPKDYT
ncbi:MAG: hypothetical protein FWC73_04185 [Defluviitaleaceae bacterium]|nr:hypothetical protein [Defluviitaleaceae bacterium]